MYDSKKEQQEQSSTIWSTIQLPPLAHSHLSPGHSLHSKFSRYILYTTKYMLQNDTFSEKPLLTTCTSRLPSILFNCHPCLFFFVALILL